MAMTTYVAFYLVYDFTRLIEANHWGRAVVTGIAWLPNLCFLLGTLMMIRRPQAAALGRRSG
jgi:hypothetical protein